MVKKIIKILLNLFIIIVSVVAFCHIPALLYKDIPFSDDFITFTQYELGFFPGHFFNKITETVSQLFNWQNITYIAEGTTVERKIFPYIVESYTYTLTLLFSALFVSLTLAIMFTILTFYLPNTVQKLLKQVVIFLEALPDIFVIFAIQLGVIWIYKHTNILVAEPFSLNSQKTYLLPIISLSIVPLIYLYKQSLLMFENELGKPYVELGVAKGLNKLYILIRHILPNILYSFFYNLKYMYLFLLSNMIILEFMFNIYGLLKFMTNHPTYEIIATGVLMLTFPLAIIFLTINALLPKGVVIYDQKAI
ncbi:ABC transporter permease subunit [Bacillus spongiae]|uniref:ABC transporter permease subunit n=1 Tax=Bacillus spongiae TaxID=2683610 RepID=A0ABU8HCL0_9BACI